MKPGYPRVVENAACPRCDGPYVGRVLRRDAVSALVTVAGTMPPRKEAP